MAHALTSRSNKALQWDVSAFGGAAPEPGRSEGGS